MQSRNTVLQRLKDPRLTDHERESLHQYLHYLDAEGIITSTSTSSNNNTHYAKNTKKKTKPTAGTSSK